MRASLVIAYSIVALAAGVACASSEDEAAPPPPPDTGTVLPDADVTEAAVDDPAPPDASADGPMCSPAGWCATSLPDVDLVLKDVWPYATRAFAVAESVTLGVKVLEWEDAAGAWKYIDDGTQNEPGFGPYVGKMWSPNENEIYYTVAPGTVYRGTRVATAWSWTRYALPDNSPKDDPTHDHGHPSYGWFPIKAYPAMGVWGTSSDDVYAWYTNTVFHWMKDDAGLSAWIPEYIADDTEQSFEHLFFLAAAGTNRDDVWFVGARDAYPSGGTCVVMVRRTPDGYRRIADGTTSFQCEERPGFLKVGDFDGWLTDVQSAGDGELVGLKSGSNVLRLSVDADSYTVALSEVPINVIKSDVVSLWSAPDRELWLTGSNLVARGSDVVDGGTYRVSTISLSGAPLNRPMYRVRGTSSTNLWSVGARYALHKTTP
jgi:hypothetical protein